jgi:hypothetical protein
MTGKGDHVKRKLGLYLCGLEAIRRKFDPSTLVFDKIEG